MQPKLIRAAVALLTVAALTPAASAVAQADVTGGAAGGGAQVPASPEIAAPSTPVPTAPATDPAAAIPPASVTGAAGPTPTPPAYLTAGPDALQLPLAGVARLQRPDVPLEPLRLAALAALLVAVLLIGSATLLRSLGLRTAAVGPSAAATGGRVEDLRDRLRLIADDMRDFLRRRR